MATSVATIENCTKISTVEPKDAENQNNEVQRAQGQNESVKHKCVLPVCSTWAIGIFVQFCIELAVRLHFVFDFFNFVISEQRVCDKGWNCTGVVGITVPLFNSWVVLEIIVDVTMCNMASVCVNGREKEVNQEGKREQKAVCQLLLP